MRGIGTMALVLAAAGWLRFADLPRAASRSDEISFLFRAQQDSSLVELWKNPPWFNQIPLADSVPVVWTRLTRQAASEGVVRQPFAVLGWLTVAFCAVWTLRRRGLGAGLLLGVWMAVLPLHVYHSREAYYYVMAMLFAAGLALRGADFAARLRSGGALAAREYIEWTFWALLLCLSHMSAWIVAGVVWLVLLLAGVIGQPAAGRKRHAIAMACVALATGAGMIRWVLRAIHEMQRAAENPEAHIGSAFGWVAPRVLPFFAGGANAIGIGILAGVLLAAGWLFWRRLRGGGGSDPRYVALTWIAWGGLAGSFLYITVVGGGEKGKLTYFLANLPAFMVWAALTLDRIFAQAGERRRLLLDLSAAALIAVLLAVPAWQVTRLDGKPAPYRQIRAWLDANLAPGDVAIVDRWWEPWNEMALYAPSNTTVNFTVPDEPYQDYVAGNWRQKTRELFERNGAQAFIRIQRNHEKRMGLWAWPETWFRHRAVVTNEAGRWLRDTGFAPMEEYYSETNRVETEIFYDTHADIAGRARAAGQEAVAFFGPGWRLFKPWRQGDFSDYRVLEGEGRMEIHNLGAEPARMQGALTAAAMGGDQTIRVGDAAPVTFAAGQLSTRTVALDLPPGVSRVSCRNLSRSGALLVREFRLERAD